MKNNKNICVELKKTVVLWIMVIFIEICCLCCFILIYAYNSKFNHEVAVNDDFIWNRSISCGYYLSFFIIILKMIKFIFYFRNIIPRILLNDISMIEKFISYTGPDDRQGVTIENVGKLRKMFVDYNNLVTSARQFIDSLVADSYQLLQLDSLSF